MSQVAHFPVPEDDQVELPISFPKKRERYKITSTQLKTDLDLAPRMKVRLIDAEGYVAKFAGNFDTDENEARWTVIIDSCVLEEIE